MGKFKSKSHAWNHSKKYTSHDKNGKKVKAMIKKSEHNKIKSIVLKNGIMQMFPDRLYTTIRHTYEFTQTSQTVANYWGFGGNYLYKNVTGPIAGASPFVPTNNSS